MSRASIYRILTLISAFVGMIIMSPWLMFYALILSILTHGLPDRDTPSEKQ